MSPACQKTFWEKRHYDAIDWDAITVTEYAVLTDDQHKGCSQNVTMPGWHTYFRLGTQC